MTRALTFDAVSEARPGPKWRRRWERSWPAYEAWFRARGGDAGPDLAACVAALARHMPEFVPVHAALARASGGGDRPAQFLSTWCPPAYLGGCSLAAHSQDGVVRLVRNYDLSPDLNEGLLLRSEWTGRPVMGMVEFLWGLSDGINAAGLAVALAFGGHDEVREGFGVTTILRYVLETCTNVADATAVLARVPSHMAYNVVLADRAGAVASVELIPGGGMRRMPGGIATNHQHGPKSAFRPGFTRTMERRAHLEVLLGREIAPDRLAEHFLQPPLFQRDYDLGFGTLFTAEYDPVGASVTLRWHGEGWHQSLADFRESTRTVAYGLTVEPEPDLAHALEALRAIPVQGVGCGVRGVACFGPQRDAGLDALRAALRTWAGRPKPARPVDDLSGVGRPDAGQEQACGRPAATLDRRSVAIRCSAPCPSKARLARARVGRLRRQRPQNCL